MAMLLLLLMMMMVLLLLLLLLLMMMLTMVQPHPPQRCQRCGRRGGRGWLCATRPPPRTPTAMPTCSCATTTLGSARCWCRLWRPTGRAAAPESQRLQR